MATVVLGIFRTPRSQRHIRPIPAQSRWQPVEGRAERAASAAALKGPSFARDPDESRRVYASECRYGRTDSIIHTERADRSWSQSRAAATRWTARSRFTKPRMNCLTFADEFAILRVEPTEESLLIVLPVRTRWLVPPPTTQRGVIDGSSHPTHRHSKRRSARSDRVLRFRCRRRRNRRGYRWRR